MNVELLYFDGCPSYERLLPRLRELVVQAGVVPDVQLRRVESAEDAVAARFLGSPTVRIDEVDIEPGAGQRSDYGLKCRLYRTADGLQGTPPDEWLLSSLTDAAAHHPEHRR